MKLGEVILGALSISHLTMKRDLEGVISALMHVKEAFWRDVDLSFVLMAAILRPGMVVYC